MEFNWAFKGLNGSTRETSHTLHFSFETQEDMRRVE